MIKILHHFERIIIITIIIMMMIAIFVSTIELGIIIGRELFKPPKFMLDIKNLLEIFGFFLMILIGLELLHTIKTYLTEECFHVEVVILVAIIAMARKIIILDLKSLNPMTLLGYALIIFALSSGYFLFKRVQWNELIQKVEK